MEKNQTITDVHQKGEQAAEDITQRTRPAKKIGTQLKRWEIKRQQQFCLTQNFNKFLLFTFCFVFLRFVLFFFCNSFFVFVLFCFF